MLSCRKGDNGTAIHLIKHYRHLINIHHQEWFKHPCLTEPTDFGKYEWLLVSPLHAAAASRGGLETVQLLLEMGVDINVRTCCQLTTSTHGSRFLTTRSGQISAETWRLCRCNRSLWKYPSPCHSVVWSCQFTLMYSCLE